jgi:DNA polymerase
VFASERTSAPEFAITPAPDPADAPPAAPDIARHPASRAADLATLQQLASRCTACARSEQRQRSVFGTGDVHPDWLLIGDAPAVADEADGVPFGGKSGQLLDNMLAAVGKGRNQGNQGHQGAYLTNLVKCCARDEQGQSRAPSADEIAACRPFLQRQIELLQPKLVLALGKTAAQALRQASPAPTPLRGVVHHMQDGNLPMVATWHPVILLQQPQEKRQVWADLCLARETEAQAVLPSGEPS